MNIDALTDMNTEMFTAMLGQLQFLRPEWLYAFIPLLLFLILMLRRHKSSMSWKSVCDAKLLPYILTQVTTKASRLPLLLVLIAASLAIVAAAGPVFEKLPQPVFREQSALVILLDLSQSMDATDIKPTRLQRARLKLLDILKARKGGQTALVVYAADAFVVTPLTDDSNTIANLVHTLETGLMPSQGSHAFRAIEKSLDLFKQSGTKRGEVLLLTDGVSDRDIKAIELLSAQGHRLSILGIGTTEGSPIPMDGGFLQDSNGAIVLPKLRPIELQQAALKGGGLYINMQADDSDIERLNTLFTRNKLNIGLDEQKLGETDLRADIWQEEGPWLLLLVIPLAALWFRKGWLVCIPLFIMPISEPSYALELDHLWRSADQKAMRAFNAGDAATAAEAFERPDWKSSAYYRAGDYEQALNALDTPVSSNDHYNRGNALAQLGRYPEAIKAYDEALRLDENNEDAAFNREQLEQAMQQNNQQQSGEQNEQSEDKQASDNEQQQSEQQSSQQQSSQQQSSEDPSSEDEASQDEQSARKESDQEQEPQQQSPQQQASQEQQADPADEQDTQPDKSEIEQAMKDLQEQEQQQSESEEQAEQEAMAMKQSESINEEDQATEQWLKRIPDDPGLLLRRKFEYQYKRLPEQTPSNEQW